MKLPKSLSHLKYFADKYPVKELKKGIYGFYIPQFPEGGHVINQDWLDFRSNTIGASEIGLVMGLDDWGTLIRLFYEKIGFRYPQLPSEPAHWGHEHEDNIARNWSYCDGEDKGYLDNMATPGYVPREYEKGDCYVINAKYPHLSMSMDFLIPAGQYSPFKEKSVEHSFPLEVKTISGWVAKKFENDIPIKYVCQVTMQMIVWECDYMEFAALMDGNKLEVLPFELSMDFTSRLLEDAERFWVDKVSPAKKWYAKSEAIGLQMEQADSVEHAEELNTEKEKWDAKIGEVEPEPDTKKAYEDFFKEHKKPSALELTRDGVDEEFDLCMEYVAVHEQEKEIKEKKQAIRNKIYKMIGTAETIDFGERGKAIWRRPEGKRQYFAVKTKIVE